MKIPESKTSITIPAKVCSNYEGYSFFTRVYHELKNHGFTDVFFDFTNNGWFEANLCAVFGALLNDCQERFINPVFNNLQPKVEDIFYRNHFFASFQGSVLPDDKGTTIRYRRNKLTEEKLI
ncbi:MAG TPA: hypothetical protein PLL90_10880, partial [Bacteroidales bacterium]|nr:hypothetical protein [Bacteroidales bacterium]